MGIASLTSLGSVSDKTAGTSITLTTTDSADPSILVVVIVAKDNAATADGNTSEVTSVTDTAGTSYVKAREFCNAQGAADAGATVAIYYGIPPVKLNTGDTIVANFSDSRTASCLSAWSYLIGVGSTMAVVGSGDLANDAADPGSIAISGLTSGEYLYVRATAGEVASGLNWTATASYTNFANASTAGGASDTNMAIRGEFIIATGTGSTSDPTWTAADCASTMVAFQESGPRIPGSLMMMGIGT